MIVDVNFMKVGVLLLVYSALVATLTMVLIRFTEDIRDKNVTISACIFTLIMILLYIFITIILCSNLGLPD